MQTETTINTPLLNKIKFNKVSFVTSDKGHVIGLNNGSLTDRAKINVVDIKRQSHVTEKLIEQASSPKIQMELM